MALNYGLSISEKNSKQIQKPKCIVSTGFCSFKISHSMHDKLHNSNWRIFIKSYKAKMFQLNIFFSFTFKQRSMASPTKYTDFWNKTKIHTK